MFHCQQCWVDARKLDDAVCEDPAASITAAFPAKEASCGRYIRFSRENEKKNKTKHCLELYYLRMHQPTRNKTSSNVSLCYISNLFLRATWCGDSFYPEVPPLGLFNNVMAWVVDSRSRESVKREYICLCHISSECLEHHLWSAPEDYCLIQ